MHSSEQLRKQLAQEGILLCPGAHDPLTARIIEAVGFEAVYMTGYGTSLSTIGYPDAGFITMPEMISNANNIQETVNIPVIADADTGYGNATNVIRTVREYIKTGVGAIHIEDQKFPKRCGHVEGREVVSQEEAAGKIRAAADVRDTRNSDFLIIARTDARGAVGGSVDEAISRANRYLEEGADIAFVEGPTTKAEVEEIGAALNGYLLYNATGISPLLDVETLQSYGYDIVILPSVSLQATLYGLFSHASELKANGISAVSELSEQLSDLPLENLHQFAGFDTVVEWERRYLPETSQEKYDNSLGANISDSTE